MVEHAGNALDDREAKTETARHLGSLVEPVEFFEYDAFFRVRNANARVEYGDARAPGTVSATDQHTALRRVFDGVRDQVLQESPQ